MTDILDNVFDGKAHVHVDNLSDLTIRTEEHEPEHFIMSTFVLATAAGANVGGGGSASTRNDIQQILELDPNRKDAGIANPDGPIVLCDTYKKAQDAANQGATVPFPQGAYLPAGSNASLAGTGPVWAVNVTPATASRVVVIINRRNP